MLSDNPFTRRVMNSSRCHRGTFLLLFILFLQFVHYYFSTDSQKNLNASTSSSSTFLTTKTEPSFVETSSQGQQQNEAHEDEFHITHVVSTFVAKPDTGLWHELDIAKRSWKDAADYALRTKGIKVEFLFPTLEADAPSVPSYAKHAVLKRTIADVFKGEVPTVGEVAQVAYDQAKGTYVIITNADIGAMENFYVSVYDWATTDFTSQTSQIKAIKAAASILQRCLKYAGYLEFGSFATHESLCILDARVTFENAGGMPSLWNTHKLQVAREAGRLCLERRPKSTKLRDIKRIETLMLEKSDDLPGRKYSEMPTPNDAVKEPYEPSPWENITDADNWMPIVKNYKVKASTKKIQKSKYFAGTVTRLDVGLNANWTNPTKEDLEEYTGDRGMRNYREGAKRVGAFHPGNDCFISERRFIPQAYRDMGHPQGVRPFGQWVTYAYKHDQVPYRRISGSRREPWTFHGGLGLWGKDSIPWIERGTDDPNYTVFLAANWDAVSNGAFKWQLLNIPEACVASKGWAWRNRRYCDQRRDDEKEEVCVGVQRLGCSDYLNWNLRDVMWYVGKCRTADVRFEPVCSFCYFLLSRSTQQTDLEKASLMKCEAIDKSVKHPSCVKLGRACLGGKDE